VKAIIRQIADRDHIIAQGQENAIRKNLSFIERTLFVKHILENGQSIETAVAALALDDTTLSKMRSVLANIPESLIRTIGPAKNTGRDRWWQLSKLLEHKDHQKADLAPATDGFSQLSSDDRFECIFVLASTDVRKPTSKTGTARDWNAPDKSVKAKISHDTKSFTLALKAKDAVRFGAYISEKLDRLYADFREAENQQPNRS
jgi:ParB family chromosome partitioning protein